MLTLRRSFKSIWRRRFRTLLVSLVLALCVAVFVSTIAGIDASEAATAEVLEGYEEIAESTIEETELSLTAITVRNMRGFMPESGDGMSEDVADDISDMDGVAAVIPTVSGGFGEEEGSGGVPGGGGGFGGGPGGGFETGAEILPTNDCVQAAQDRQSRPGDIRRGRRRPRRTRTRSQTVANCGATDARGSGRTQNAGRAAVRKPRIRGAGVLRRRYYRGDHRPSG